MVVQPCKPASPRRHSRVVRRHYFGRKTLILNQDGIIVKWAILLSFVVLMFAYFVGGYLHARWRLKKGLAPLAYHRVSSHHAGKDILESSSQVISSASLLGEHIASPRIRCTTPTAGITACTMHRRRRCTMAQDRPCTRALGLNIPRLTRRNGGASLQGGRQRGIMLLSTMRRLDHRRHLP